MKSRSIHWCVYIIRLFATQKVYIGSTARWSQRPTTHIRDLERGQHYNSLLQRAFNKYGDKGMSITILETVDPTLGIDNLLRKEEFWITFFHSAQRKFGFNLASKPTKSTLGVKRSKAEVKRIKRTLTEYRENPENAEAIKCSREQAIANGFIGPKEYILYSPDGVETKILNLKAFCRDNNLNYGKLHAVVIGRSIHYKGWKTSPDRNDKVKRHFRLLSPDDTLVEGFGLRGFAIKNGLSYQSLCQVVSGRTKNYNGWRLPDKSPEYFKPNLGKSYILIGPNDQEVKVTNLKEWCRNCSDHPCYESITVRHTSKGWRIKQAL